MLVLKVYQQCRFAPHERSSGITASQLAERADVTWKTIQRFETADGIPPSRSGTLDRVKSALETAGIEFIGDPLTSPGVRLRRP